MLIELLTGIALWALIPGFIAKKKGKSFLFYFLISFIITPLISMVITLCMQRSFFSDVTYTQEEQAATLINVNNSLIRSCEEFRGNPYKLKTHLQKAERAEYVSAKDASVLFYIYSNPKNTLNTNQPASQPANNISPQDHFIPPHIQQKNAQEQVAVKEEKSSDEIALDALNYLKSQISNHESQPITEKYNDFIVKSVEEQTTFIPPHTKMKSTRKNNQKHHFSHMGKNDKSIIILTVLSALVVALIISVIVMAFKLSDIQGDAKVLKTEKSQLTSQITNQSNEIDRLTRDSQKYKDFYYDARIKADFLDEYIALVTSNSEAYHTYDCEKFKNTDEFWAYNIEAAESQGYYPCHSCHK